MSDRLQEVIDAVPVTPFYRDERTVIYNADCRDVLPHLPRFDLLLTDPPYGIDAANMTMGKGQSNKARRDRIVDADWDTQKPSLVSSLAKAKLICVWGGNYFTDELPPTNNWLVWHKMNDGRSFSECELAWTNYSKQVRHFQWSWLHGGETKVHKTQKPVPLMQWCLGFAPDAETILDPFAGVCTTLVAAKLEGRYAVGIEISEEYCRKAAERLRQKVLF